jgi:hypothetical protein
MHTTDTHLSDRVPFTFMQAQVTYGSNEEELSAACMSAYVT